MENFEEALDRDISSDSWQSEEFTNLPIVTFDQTDGARMKNIEQVFDSDISSANSQSVEALENLKMKERRGNVVENKGPLWKKQQRRGNVVENTGRYALKAGMLCAPQRRGSPVGGSPTQIVVGKSGS